MQRMELEAVCAWCTVRRRTAVGSWESIPESCALGQDIELTHGICPECFNDAVNNLSPTPAQLYADFSI
jgi:hypothetical protein